MLAVGLVRLCRIHPKLIESLVRWCRIRPVVSEWYVGRNVRFSE